MKNNVNTNNVNVKTEGKEMENKMKEAFVNAGMTVNEFIAAVEKERREKQIEAAKAAAKARKAARKAAGAQKEARRAKRREESRNARKAAGTFGKRPQKDIDAVQKFFDAIARHAEIIEKKKAVGLNGRQFFFDINRFGAVPTITIKSVCDRIAAVLGENVDENLVAVWDILKAAKNDAKAQRKHWLTSKIVSDMNNLRESVKAAKFNFAVREMIDGAVDINDKKVVIDTPEKFQHFYAKVLARGNDKKANMVTMLVFNSKDFAATPLTHIVNFNQLTPLIKGTFMRGWFASALGNIFEERMNVLQLIVRLNGVEEEAKAALERVFDKETGKMRRIFRILGTRFKTERFLVENYIDQEVIRGREYWDIVNWEPVSRETLVNSGLNGNGYVVYDTQFSGSSTGELKNNIIVLNGRYVGDKFASKLSVNWTMIYNKLTSGAWKEYQKRVDQGKEAITPKAVAQFATRTQLFKAFSLPLDGMPIRVFAVYGGTFQRANIVDNNSEAFDFVDGWGAYSNEALFATVTAEVKRRNINAEIKPEAIRGLLLQCRPYFTCKQTAEGLDTIDIKTLISSFDSEPVILYKEDMVRDKKLQEKWLDFSFGKGKGEWKGKVVVICTDRTDDPNQVGFFTDCNGMKTGSQIWKFQTGFNVLSVAATERLDGRLSTQFNQTLAAVDYKGALLYLNGASRVYVEDEIKKVMNVQGEALTFADFDTDESWKESENGELVLETVEPRFDRLTQRAFPAIGWNNYMPTRRNMVNKKLQTICKTMGKVNLPTTCMVGMLNVDPAAMAGTPVLGYKDGILEVFVPGFETETAQLRRLRERDETKQERILAAITDPAEREAVNKIAPPKHLYQVGIKCDELLARYDAVATEHAKTLEKEEAERYLALMDIAKKRVRDAAPGTIFVPAYKECALAGGGWDYDGDHAIINLEFGIMNRYPKAHSREYFKVCDWCNWPETLVVNKDGQGKDLPEADSVCDKEVAEEARKKNTGFNIGVGYYVNYVCQGIKNVGQVTNMFNPFSHLAWQAKQLLDAGYKVFGDIKEKDIKGNDNLYRAFTDVKECLSLFTKNGGKHVTYQTPLRYSNGPEEGYHGFDVVEITLFDCFTVFERLQQCVLKNMTCEEIYRAMYDCEAVKRALQETTIDYTKSPVKNFHIPCGDKIEAIKPLSKQTLEVVAKWNEQNIEAKGVDFKETRTVEVELGDKKAKFVKLCDFNQLCIKDGVEALKAFALDCVKAEAAHFDDNTVADIIDEEAFSTVEERQALQAVKMLKEIRQGYTSAVAEQQKNLLRVSSGENDYSYVEGCKVLKQHKKVVYNTALDMIRTAMMKIADPVKKIQLMLYLAGIRDENPDWTKIADIATVLEQEWFLFCNSIDSDAIHEVRDRVHFFGDISDKAALDGKEVYINNSLLIGKNGIVVGRVSGNYTGKAILKLIDSEVFATVPYEEMVTVPTAKANRIMIPLVNQPDDKTVQKLYGAEDVITAKVVNGQNILLAFDSKDGKYDFVSNYRVNTRSYKDETRFVTSQCFASQVDNKRGKIVEVIPTMYEDEKKQKKYSAIVVIELDNEAASLSAEEAEHILASL